MKKKSLIFLAIALNLIGLYLLVDLATYDEMIAFLKHGEKYSSPTKMALFLLFTSLINLAFLVYYSITIKQQQD